MKKFLFLFLISFNCYATNYVMLTDGTGKNSKDSNLVWDKALSTLGIGTINPIYPLHVIGDAFISHDLTVANLANGFVVSDGAGKLSNGSVSLSSIINVAAGNISSANGQDAINELDTEKEALVNKSTTLSADQASNTKYPSVKSVYDWAIGLFQTLANKDATGGYAGLTLFKINFKNAANTFTSFFTNTNTAARTYSTRDRDGILADDTDLATKITGPISGDGTTPSNTSGILTLATVNSNVGSFGSASSSLNTTVNAKGLVTAISSQAIAITESQVASLTTDLAAKEPAIATGTTSQFWNGAKSFVTITSDKISEVTNLFFTNARAIAATLTAYAKAAGTISSSDTILGAIQKLDANDDLKSPLDGDKSFYIFDDFVNTAMGETPFTAANSGGTSTVSSVGIDGTQNAIGVTRFTATASTDRATLGMNNFLYLGSGSGWTLDSSFRIAPQSAVSDGTNTYILHFGFCDTSNAGTSNPCVNGVYFRHSTNVSGHWECVNRTAGADTNAVDSGITYGAAGTYKLFRLQISTGGVATFSINGSVVCTISSGLVVPSVVVTPFMKLIKSLGSGAISFDVDYFSMLLTRTTAR